VRRGGLRDYYRRTPLREAVNALSVKARVRRSATTALEASSSLSKRGRQQTRSPGYDGAAPSAMSMITPPPQTAQLIARRVNKQWCALTGEPKT